MTTTAPVVYHVVLTQQPDGHLHVRVEDTDDTPDNRMRIVSALERAAELLREANQKRGY